MADYPLINGTKHDWSSIEVDLGDAGIFTGISELTYSDTLEPGIVRGASPQKLARTRGEYNAEGSMNLWLQDAREFMDSLGPGFKEVVFNITAMYSAVGSEVVTDRLIGCRITSTESGGSQGPDPIGTTFGLDIIRIEWNGVDPLTDMLK